MSNYTHRVIEQVFNHIVLPPRLPNESDANVGLVNGCIIQHAIEAIVTLSSLSENEPQNVWGLVKRSLHLCASIHDDDHIDRVNLMDAFDELKDGANLILHISEQNAGLLIRPVRHGQHVKEVVIECFEASPTSESVLACTGALKCDYPGSAVTMPLDPFQDSSFRDALAMFLEQSSGELVERFAAKAKKAGATIVEPRDTASPHIITQLLMSLLEAYGSQTTSPILRKRVRDDVCWKNAFLPWRRSPFYMVIRVGIQRMLYSVCGPEEGRAYYKTFIAMIHARLLQNSTGMLSVELCHFLRAKLCRRLSKLEVERDRLTCGAYSHLLNYYSACFSDIIKSATLAMDIEWKKFKDSTQRRTPALPLRAAKRDMCLELPNSLGQLKSILKSSFNTKTSFDKAFIPKDLNTLVNKHFRTFSERYAGLHTLQQEFRSNWTAFNGSKASCALIAKWIRSYLDQMPEIEDNVHELSLMTIDLFELWAIMDRIAVRKFPLLAEYSCGFQPNLLDVLLLSLRDDLGRLHRIQQYITERERNCQFKTLTIFSDPTSNGFSDLYVRRSADKKRFQALADEIEHASERARKDKIEELQSVNERYSDLSQKVMSPCTREWGEPRLRCIHCTAKIKRKKLKIHAHEDFLPKEGILRRAVIFELAMPSELAEYRDTTWRVLSMLGIPRHGEIATGPAPRGLLREYGSLKTYNQHKGLLFHMGARTKSFLVSHYKGPALPASRSQVLLPFGPDLSYYDTVNKRWSSRLPVNLTFAHLFPLDSSVLGFMNLQGDPDFAANADGRSSYEIITRQNENPVNVTVHEYTTFQSLLSTQATRWLSLLRELGSSNLNFSQEATMHLVSYLALQVGPNPSDNLLRQVHHVFEDPEFCHQLATQVQRILSRICNNWRESFCMDMLLTLILRIVNLGPESVAAEGHRLLHCVRQITSDWAGKIRHEIQSGVSAETAERLSVYGLLSGILCKRTFSAQQDSILDSNSLQTFLAASLTIQENVQDPARLSSTIRGMLVRDLRISFSLESLLRNSILECPSAIGSAIETVWPHAINSERTYSYWKIVPRSGGWMESQVTETEFFRPQIVHYHPSDGHLLVDGKPIGKLPSEFRDSPSVQELFGHEHLLIFPSAMRGMDFTLAAPRNGHAVHFGRMRDDIVVRTYVKGNPLHLVPRHVFGEGAQADLPAPLVTDCFHWLNLKTRQLDVRRRKHVWWFSRQGNWTIDVDTCQASRRSSRLVDPHSELFRQVAKIFDGFEDPENISVIQPTARNVTVEMKRMDLNFGVNARGILVCRQLHAEIDQDQDAGTWYGLQSKIVMCSTSNRMQRSIVVPVGSLRYHRNGPHVLVRVTNDGRYARYEIDSTLGRLKCEPEPLLVYTKSLLHAFTSFPLPDILTGRTGTEEALACLMSALSQPWNPVGPSQAAPLVTLTRLTPNRFYYPEHLQRQQKINWDKELTFTTQHELYRPIIQAMATKLERLSKFALDDCHPLQLEPDGVSFLRDRNHFRRRLFEREGPCVGWLGKPKDNVYAGRHRRQRSTSAENTYQIAHIFMQKPSNIRTTSLLAAIFDQAPWIMGRTEAFNKRSLNDLLKVDVVQEWGPLTELCRQFSDKPHSVMFDLATIAFTDDVNMELVRTLAAICINDDLRSVCVPPHSEFIEFKLNERPSIELIMRLIQSHLDVSSKSLRQAIKENKVLSSTTLTEFGVICEQEAQTVAALILAQWPQENLVCPSIAVNTFDLRHVVKSIKKDWLRLFRNFKFEKYLCGLQRLLERQKADSKIVVPAILDAEERYPSPCKIEAVPILEELFSKKGPAAYKHQRRHSPGLGQLRRDESDADANVSAENRQQSATSGNNSRVSRELGDLIDKMILSKSKSRQDYALNLKSSLDSLESYQAHQSCKTEVPSISNMEGKINKARNSAEHRRLTLIGSLTKSDVRYKWLSAGQLWPCLTPVTILQRLRSSGQQKFGSRMKEALLDYGVSVTQLQQLLRINDAIKKNDSQRSRDECENPGHENWQPEVFPDWLLMEIDANILIRKTQVDVALATISPASGSNSVLQMNMGQGKTSVVMPMALCALANGKNLGRLMVPKSLLLQTAQTIQSRLGDLVGREVLHIPFSRRSPTEPATIEDYRALHKQVLQSRGIILTLPEHVLSFRLSGFQCLSDSKINSSSAILSTDSWFTRTCRDVIDECDFSLAVKTQLIYPSGSQLPLDGHPNRWRTAHMLLGLIEEHLSDLESEFPGSIEVVRRPGGGFPFVYILRPMVEEALLTRLVGDLCSGKTNILPLVQPHMQDSVRNFICNVKVEQSACETVFQSFNSESIALKNLFLLRGLIGHEVLLLCLKKRWNVQYGLHPARSPIAVPFHAKGVPSEQAEWGHPDVAILLTCLAFYYDGLTVDQLRLCLQNLSQSDDPSGEYDRWGAYVHDLPEPLRHWNLISIDDDTQVREVWSYLRYGVTVVNYFLDHCVFPIHAKQFSQRLQLSGWDIPSFSTQQSKTPMFTTGFSGTNDDRFLLPLTIKQNDLAALSHTNAEVLSYLLHSRNRSYVVASGQNGKRLSEEQFIRKLYSMDIRILIDAGAHIIEYDNQSLARKWLEIDHGASAAVYFDSGSKPLVIDRNHKEVPLLASSFANNLDSCLVFLDEAHTRGTDLKFPPSSRGALTLSLGQTKDHTVQAAMRLRQLGTTQSVVFVATPEVHQSVLDLRRKSSKDAIDSADVIAWLLEQTCRHHEQLKSLYFAQGYDFCRRIDAAFVNDKFLTDPEHRLRFLGTLLQREERSLEKLYSPTPNLDIHYGRTYTNPQIIKFGANLDRQRLGGVTPLATASTFAFAEFEQERECMFHVEEVREIQKPTRYPHRRFPGLHPAIRGFVITGCLEGSAGYELALTALQRTMLGVKHRLRAEPRSRLFISDEFRRAVKLKKDGHWREDLLRPVHWLLWSPSTSTALIIIPEEAECVLSLIKASKTSPTHLLVYAAPFAKSMLHFNSLDFYAYPTLPENHRFPSTLKIELGLLSGRLFFTYEEYTEILRYFGHNETGHNDPNKNTESLSTIPPEKPRTQENNFLIFLQQWLTMTRKGREFSHTPMGYVCQNRRLDRNHALFVDRTVEVNNVARLSRLNWHAEDENDSGDDDEMYFDVDG